MRDYLKRLVEIGLVGFMTGAGTYVADNGLELSGASLRGLAVAAGLAAYGVIVKKLGEDNRPTIK